jgi:hypothetical protein
MRKGFSIMLGVLALLLGALAGCNDTSLQGSATEAQLSGAQEVPPVTTPATGAAQAIVSEDRQIITVTLTAQGFTSPVAAAHIHAGAPGVNGPVIFTLFDSGVHGFFASPYTVTLDADDLQAAPAFNITTLAEAIQAIETGQAYVNIHTANNPDGEIRGQLTLIQE